MFNISKDEFGQIAISVIAISFALSLFTLGGQFTPDNFLVTMGIMGLTVGVGFVFHELAHKFTAMRFGAKARYVAWTQGLAIMLILSVIPLIFGWGIMFIAPGAVYIYGRSITRKQNGLISLAGPITNLAIAAAFFSLTIFAPLFSSLAPIIYTVAAFGTRVNVFLALFNLIPFPPLDGSKVFAWNPAAWLAVGGFTAILFIFLGGF